MITLSRHLSRTVPCAIQLAKPSSVRPFQRALTSWHAPTPKPSYRPYILGATVAGIGTAFFFAQKEKEYKPNASISSGKYTASYYNPIPDWVTKRMINNSYKKGCPVSLADLAYVKVLHYNMEGKICSGELVVHKSIAMPIMQIFQEIFEAKFPIEKMKLIDDYDADDARSMADNNSSAFCYRPITGRTGVISKHGLGRAVDINTLQNPYVKGDVVAPPNGRKYTDRSLDEPGMIHPDGPVVTAFKRRGFKWGGDWSSLKDYQHFEVDPDRC